MKLLDGSWFTRIYYADGLSTIIPYAPIRSDSGQEQAVYYLSRVLQGPKKNYSPIEKMCLSLYFAATKLRHYFLSTTVLVIARTDLIKYMLTRPVLKGRIGKWILGLSEFTFRYVPMKAVKGQAFEVNVHKDREVVAVNLSTRVVLGRRCLLFFNMEFKSDPRV